MRTQWEGVQEQEAVVLTRHLPYLGPPAPRLWEMFVVFKSASVRYFFVRLTSSDGLGRCRYGQIGNHLWLSFLTPRESSGAGTVVEQIKLLPGTSSSGTGVPGISSHLLLMCLEGSRGQHRCLGPATHVRDLKWAPGFWFQPGLIPAILGTWDWTSRWKIFFPTLPSYFQKYNLFKKGKTIKG